VGEISPIITVESAIELVITWVLVHVSRGLDRIKPIVVFQFGVTWCD